MKRVDIREARLVGESLVLKLRYMDEELTLKQFVNLDGYDVFRLVNHQRRVHAECPLKGIPAHRVKALGLPVRHSHLFARATAHLYPRLKPT